MMSMSMMGIYGEFQLGYRISNPKLKLASTFNYLLPG